MIAAEFLAAWLFLGWLGWRVTIAWWTIDLDMERGDRAVMRWWIVLGPFNLASASCLYFLDRDERRTTGEHDILYPRKDT